MYETSWFKKKSLEAFLITLWYSENQFAYLQSTKNGKGTYMILLASVKMLLFSKHFSYIKILTSERKYLSVKICII